MKILHLSFVSLVSSPHVNEVNLVNQPYSLILMNQIVPSPLFPCLALMVVVSSSLFLLHHHHTKTQHSPRETILQTREFPLVLEVMAMRHYQHYCHHQQHHPWCYHLVPVVDTMHSYHVHGTVIQWQYAARRHLLTLLRRRRQRTLRRRNYFPLDLSYMLAVAVVIVVAGRMESDTTMTMPRRWPIRNWAPDWAPGCPHALRPDSCSMLTCGCGPTAMPA